MAFRLEPFASFDYFNNLCFASLNLWREVRNRLTSTYKNRRRSGSVQLNLTPPSWRFSCGFGEDPGEMALVGESALERYFNE
jgi:hypothetical protein